MEIALSGFRVPTPILMRRSKSQQRAKATPLVKRLLQGLGATSGEFPASVPHKRVEALKAEVALPRKPLTLRDFFMRVTARDLVEIDGKQFASITEETSIAEAIDVMVKNRVTAIPVKNAAGSFTSVFTVSDIIEHLIESGATIRMKDVAMSEPYRCSLVFHNEFSKQAVKDIARSPWVTVGGRATLLDCLAHFGSQSTHLLGVVSREGENDVIGILHRIQILKFLHYNKDLAKEIMLRPITVFKHLNQPVSLKKDNHTVKAHSIQDLFSVIWQKVLDGDMVSYGHSNVDKFINFLVQILMVENEELPEPDYDTIKETDTVEHIFDLIVRANTANMKVIVLDSEKKPIGTLCFCDVLTELYRMACSGCIAPKHCT